MSRNRVNIFENDTGCVAQVALAGFNRDDIEVTMKEGLVNVKAVRDPPDALGACTYRGFYESLDVNLDLVLSSGTDSESTTCKFTNGILEISAPWSKSKQPKKLTVA